MRNANETRLNCAGSVATALEVAGTLSISDEVERAAADVYEIDPLHDSRWTALVESHPRSSVFHSPNWLRALQTVYGYRAIAMTTSPPESR